MISQHPLSNFHSIGMRADKVKEVRIDFLDNEPVKEYSQGHRRQRIHRIIAVPWFWSSC